MEQQPTYHTGRASLGTHAMQRDMSLTRCWGSWCSEWWWYCCPLLFSASGQLLGTSAV